MAEINACRGYRVVKTRKRCCKMTFVITSGIYVGEGKVIHFTTRARGFFMNSSSSSSSSIGDSPCPRCGIKLYPEGVNSCCIDCFLLGGDLYLYKYGVTQDFFVQIRGGTCTLAQSDPPKVVIRRAKYLLRDDLSNYGFGSYDLLRNNCEDFALYCKTGLLVFGESRSGQVSTFTALISFGNYSSNRLAADIGLRHDAVKVPVEQVGISIRTGRYVRREEQSGQGLIKAATQILVRLLSCCIQREEQIKN